MGHCSPVQRRHGRLCMCKPGISSSMEAQFSWFSTATNWFSRITSSKPKNGPFQWVGNQVVGSLHGRTEYSWQNLNIKRKHVRGKSMAGWPGRNIEKISNYIDMGKAKVHLDIKLAGDMQRKTRFFYKYVSSKRKTWENVSLLLKWAGVLVTKHPEKTEKLSAFFGSVFIYKSDLQESYSSQACRRMSGSRKIYTWWGRIRLGSIQTNWICMSPWDLIEVIKVLRKLSDVIARSILIIPEIIKGEVPEEDYFQEGQEGRSDKLQDG